MGRERGEDETDSETGCMTGRVSIEGKIGRLEGKIGVERTEIGGGEVVGR